MGSITLDIWLIILGAVAGIAGALVARGSNRFIKSAIAGVIAVIVATLLRNIF